MGRGKRTRLFNKYQTQFLQENNADLGGAEEERQCKRTRADPAGMVNQELHQHTAVNVTQCTCVTISTSYFCTPSTEQPGQGNGSNPTQINGAAPTELAPYSEVSIDDQYSEYIEDVMPQEKAKRQRRHADDPQKMWLPERDIFLLELLRLESRGEARDISVCRGQPGCLNKPGYRCVDCEGTHMLCQSCVLDQHQVTPLHRIESWSGAFFKHTSLRQLGLRIQLGHALGSLCCNPEPAHHDDNFILVDLNGIHSVALDFCNCETAQAHHIQLLRARWYPATTSEPKTAATFRLLDHFQMYTLESKGSAFEYYHALSHLTENTGVNPPKDRYEAFLRMSRQYRHLLALKRSGRGHDPGGVLATREGELAVLCPACPQVGKNLPSDWMAHKEKQWLYGLFLGIDANFRMCRRDKSSEAVDPSFSQGWAYFVEQSAFKETINNTAGLVQEKSSCVSHNAVNLADTKNNRGLAATGIGTVDCARHNLKRPGAVGDLQKGERYVNMDYIFFTSMLHAKGVNVLNISYDIACQWSKNLWQRMLQYPESIHFERAEKSITWLVPKFHLPAHIQSCQTAYSFNFHKGMGRTDGEAPERHRQDTLDDHFSDWNWKKTTMFGITLQRKLKEAVPERDQHAQDLLEFEKAIPPSSLSKWHVEVEAWENDNAEPNPFESRVSAVTQASVHLQLSPFSPLGRSTWGPHSDNWP
ncbi:hypothetical protein PAXINDRAFT_16915 [Paxillus involutus ATCC 200175]|uniref:CxC2-like cysteine cluster KDZ transposase-associated domain-containing protein n=1 Tax=Paxillus involutus ATCC 200175 TaxID=664439 RepID=A0A0C9T372_PAXIN|nr:hypothetical protein PAXINDRAFT_16915 [Paxillus involutus ATCC 200175]